MQPLLHGWIKEGGTVVGDIVVVLVVDVVEGATVVEVVTIDIVNGELGGGVVVIITIGAIVLVVGKTTGGGTDGVVGTNG